MDWGGFTRDVEDYDCYRARIVRWAESSPGTFPEIFCTPYRSNGIDVNSATVSNNNGRPPLIGIHGGRKSDALPHVQISMITGPSCDGGGRFKRLGVKKARREILHFQATIRMILADSDTQ